VTRDEVEGSSVASSAELIAAVSMMRVIVAVLNHLVSTG